MIQGLAERVEETIDDDIPTEVPFEGAIVVAESGGRRYEARTATDGTYRMRVPTGRYRLEVQVPEGLKRSDLRVWMVRRGAGHARRAAGDFAVLADGRISGRVVDAHGDPVAQHDR